MKLKTVDEKNVDVNDYDIIWKALYYAMGDGIPDLERIYIPNLYKEGVWVSNKTFRTAVKQLMITIN